MIGSVYGIIPKFTAIESYARAKWKHLGLIAVHSIAPNVFLFNFKDESAKMAMLQGGPYSCYSRPMILQA